MKLPKIFHSNPQVDADVDNPGVEIRVGMAAIGLFFVGFLGWAVAAPLDAAAFIGGEVMVSGGPQGVQSKDGGVVQALYIHEGQRVQKDQLLIDLASDDIRDTVSSLTSRVMARRAEQARLEAERVGDTQVRPWASMRNLRGEEAVEAARMLQAEQVQLHSRLAAVRAQRAVLAQKVIQGRQQVLGSESELVALRAQSESTQRELETMRALAEKGYAPRMKVEELERSRAGYQGSIGSRNAEVARLGSAVGEANLQLADFDARRAQQIADEMRESQDDMRALEPQLAAARALLRRTEVRAPVSGRVYAVKVNTVGGVAQPGDVLMRIMPEPATLVIDGKLAARDSGGVMVGQTARVKFPALHDRSLGNLEGVISKISADSFADERTGAEFFKVEVQVPAAELEKLRKQIGATAASGMTTGMPAQVMVTLRKRTALQYAFEPLTQTFSRSLHEH